MGGTNSKPAAAHAIKSKGSSAITFCAFAKSEEKKRDSTIVDRRSVFRGCPEEAIFFLNVKLSLDLLSLIVAYWDFEFDFDETFFDKKNSEASSLTINMNPKWLFFGKDILPDKAAYYLIWGFPEKVETIIRDNPYVMLVNTKASDHIDTLEGTLLEIALQVNDTLIKSEYEDDRTMAEMIEQYLSAHFGEQEVQKQKDRVRPILKLREESNLANRAEDKNALQVVCQALLDSKPTFKGSFNKNQNLMKAFAAFERQLKTPGDWMILVDAVRLYRIKHSNLDDYNKYKHDFYKNLILGTIELRRCRVWELQAFMTSRGINSILTDEIFGSVVRKDMHSCVDFKADDMYRSRFKIGAMNRLGRRTHTFRLGFNLSFDAFGNFGATHGHATEAQHFKDFFQAKTSALDMIMLPQTHTKCGCLR